MSSSNPDFVATQLERLIIEFRELRKEVRQFADTEGNRLLSVKEAATEAKVSEGTIKNWCYDGSLQYEQPTPRGNIKIRKRALIERLKKV